MLYIFYLTITVIYSVLVCVFGSIYCLFSPRSLKYMATFGYMLGRLAPLFNPKVECRRPAGIENYGNTIYTVNHQDNCDVVTVSDIVQPPTVTVGKKSLLWILFFGQLYWLTGNSSVDRNNHTKAHGTVTKVVSHFRKRHTSIWMFPEGTRSCDRGLLPFKIGTSHAVVVAGIPIIPVCVSTASNKISLDRPHNGLMIIEMLPSVNVSQYDKDQVRGLAAHCRPIIEQKIAELNKRVAGREATGKV